jgi:hypothetical protein
VTGSGTVGDRERTSSSTKEMTADQYAWRQNKPEWLAGLCPVVGSSSSSSNDNRADIDGVSK